MGRQRGVWGSLLLLFIFSAFHVGCPEQWHQGTVPMEEDLCAGRWVLGSEQPCDAFTFASSLPHRGLLSSCSWLQPEH